MASPTQTLAHRGTGMTDDGAVPETDPGDTTSLLLERLQAYKHACADLETYFTAHEKAERAHAKEYEKVLKSVSTPLREGHHFDQKLGGIAGLFENIRSNTQGVANTHLEVEKNIKGSVLPILSRLHTEIKNKTAELNKGAAKGSKDVSKARNSTQKHVEMLGQHSAAFSSSGGRVDPANDPYIIQRGVNHRLHKQVLEENNNRHDLLAVQESFAAFEAHIIATFQQALNAFLQFTGSQLEREKAMYSDIVSNVQRIPPDFEWKSFVHRNNTVLLDPSAPKRTASTIGFPNQDHPSTRPLIAGSLQRKSRVALKGYDSGYYVITPSRYLHQFSDDDDVRKDPAPDLSLYLPDCTLGGVNGVHFSLKGKDVSKGKMGSAMAMSHELNFKAQTTADAERWYAVIKEANSGATSTSAVSSPVESRSVSGQISEKQPPPIQTKQQPTDHQTSPLTPDGGVQPGSTGAEKLTSSQSAGTTGSGSIPNSGVERAPGQY